MSNGSVPNTFAVTVDEFEGVCREISDSMTEMKEVINVHAEIECLHRFILERFVPKELYKKAVQDFYAQRKAMIEAESTQPDAKAN